MSNRLNYIKKFIIFKNDYSNVKGLKAKGHGKLELKGNNLNVSLNIKGAEANNFYDVDFIKRREAYTVGKIYTKEDKSGERELDINYRELEKNGFSLDEVDGIILSRNENVLFGESLKGTGKSLKSYIEHIEKEEKMAPKQETIPNEEVEKEIKIEYIEEDTIPIGDMEETFVANVEQGVLLEEVQEEEVQEETQEETQEEINVEYIQEIAEEGPEEIFTEAELKFETTEITPKRPEELDEMFSEKMYEEIMEEIFNIPELGYESCVDTNDSEINNKNKVEADKMSEYVRNILNFFPNGEPFTMTLEGYDWWKIDMGEVYGDKSFLPYSSYIIGGNNKSDRFDEGVDPQKLLDIYGHYIFGLYNEGEGVKFYIYGIPGKFSIEDYPKGGTTGFNTWFEGIEVPGYWILYIEPETGKILYPINPMIPKA